MSFRDLRAVERRRALSTTFRAALVATPLMIPVAVAFNASELGLQVGIGLTEVSVGIALTALAMLAASHRALSRFERSLDLSLAVRG
ncbi:MAG: hypothetical protein QM621_03250 [Aeromicrobium sp.]|uniref:hypothetical protein n=1 Tax=Aeromicrobium sp. TaxID=1871063 RepID=UPI0039E56684